MRVYGKILKADNTKYQLTPVLFTLITEKHPRAGVVGPGPRPHLHSVLATNYALDPSNEPLGTPWALATSL